MSEQLHPGDIVSYVLRPSDRPVHPEKQWKGQVKRVVSGTYILVESLEDGYGGETEYITFDQIKSIQQVTGYPS
jgi:hypothetical protein